MNNMTLSEARKHLGLTLQDLARGVRSHTSTIWRLENNEFTPGEALAAQIEAYFKQYDIAIIYPRSASLNELRQQVANLTSKLQDIEALISNLNGVFYVYKSTQNEMHKKMDIDQKNGH